MRTLKPPRRQRLVADAPSALGSKPNHRTKYIGAYSANPQIGVSTKLPVNRTAHRDVQDKLREPKYLRFCENQQGWSSLACAPIAGAVHSKSYSGETQNAENDIVAPRCVEGDWSVAAGDGWSSPRPDGRGAGCVVAATGELFSPAWRCQSRRTHAMVESRTIRHVHSFWGLLDHRPT